LFVAGRQHALLTLMHDGAHGSIHRVRVWNDLVSDVFCAWPMLVQTRTYREFHLSHHRFLNTERDPEIQIQQKHGRGERGRMQHRSTRAILADLALDVAGRGVLEMVTKLRRLGSGAETRSREHGTRLGRFLLAATAITACGAWLQVVLFWFVPLFTFLPALL